MVEATYYTALHCNLEFNFLVLGKESQHSLSKRERKSLSFHVATPSKTFVVTKRIPILRTIILLWMGW